MIRTHYAATALAALALGYAAPAAAAAPATPGWKASPTAVAPFTSRPILVRTSVVHAAPPSEPDGETFPGQLAMAKPASKAKAAPRKVAQAKTETAPAAAAAVQPANEAALSMTDWRELDPQNTLVIDTSKGRVIVELLPEAAPAHVQRIKELARVGLYDGLVFFRVIDRFMAQTGDPSNTGEGASEQPNLKAEFIFRRDKETPFVAVAKPMGLELGFIRSAPIVSQSMDYSSVTSDGKVAAWATYCPGVAGMARDEDPDSANSQFFIMRDAYPSLDKRYTVWGRAVVGVEAIRSIKTGEPVQDPDRMTRVRVLADIPEAERPLVRVVDTRGEGFRRLVEKTRAARGADFSVCDVQLPVQVTEPAPAPAAAPAATPPAPRPSSGHGPAA